jgi:regulator of chromosome condensation
MEKYVFVHFSARFTCPDLELQVLSWGINDNAALGRDTVGQEVDAEELEAQPLPVQDLDQQGFRAVRVAAGDSVSLAISEKGEVRAWGSFRVSCMAQYSQVAQKVNAIKQASEGLLGFDKDGEERQFHPVKVPVVEKQPIAQIVTGTDHVLALTTNGTVLVFGNGEQQQLGRKIIQRRKANGLQAEPLGLKKIVLVGAGSYHSFAVDHRGTVFAWGLNTFRQTGVSEDEGGWQDIVVAPTPVDSLSPRHHGDARVVQISGGEHHTLFLFSNGEVWSCGRADGFEPGLDPEHPEMVAARGRRLEAQAEQNARAKEAQERVVAENKHLDGAEAAVQAAEAAAAGVAIPNEYIPEPTKVAFPVDGDSEPKIVQIAAGTRHNLAVSSTGKVYGWGLGGESQLGLGNVEEQPTPMLVTSKELQGYKVLKASTGGQHSMLVAHRVE